jgi:hypothetical protein
MKSIKKTILSIAMSVIITASSCISAFAQCDEAQLRNQTEAIIGAQVIGSGLDSIIDPMEGLHDDYYLWSMGKIVEVNTRVLPSYITSISDTSFTVFLSTVMGLSIMTDSSYKTNKIKAGAKAALLAGLSVAFKSLLSSSSKYYVETIISRKYLGNGLYDYWIITSAYSDPYGANRLRYTQQHVTA